jgi:hypothetical protein
MNPASAPHGRASRACFAADFSALQPFQAITVRLDRDTGPLTPVVEDRRLGGPRLRVLWAHRLIRQVPGRHSDVVSPGGRQGLTALLAARAADVQLLAALAA